MTTYEKSELRKIIEGLTVHTIRGYEWECDSCHYHWAERQVIVPYVESRVIPQDCPTCHASITEDGPVDANGRPSQHERMIDLDALLEALA